MPTTAASRGAPTVAYQPRRPALADRALDRAVRNALRQLRADCVETLDAASSQAFSDAQRGRALGTLCLSRMLHGARRAGARMTTALQLVWAIEGEVRSVWTDERSPGAHVALQRETEAQAAADVAQMQSALTMSVADLERAIEHTAQQLTAGRELLAALTAELNRRRL